jgi:hypothetical protein
VKQRRLFREGQIAVRWKADRFPACSDHGNAVYRADRYAGRFIVVANTIDTDILVDDIDVVTG